MNPYVQCHFLDRSRWIKEIRDVHINIFPPNDNYDPDEIKLMAGSWPYDTMPVVTDAQVIEAQREVIKEAGMGYLKLSYRLAQLGINSLAEDCRLAALELGVDSLYGGDDE